MDVWEKHYLCSLIANRYINDTEGRDRGNEAGEGLRTLHSQNYNIASIAEDAGFKHVRTMQRKLTDALGLTPAEYRALYTRDL